MSEVEREQPQEVTLPIEWHVPDNDELEWHNIVSTPHVRHGLRRLAAEARRQFAAGETEKGGFAVE